MSSSAPSSAKPIGFWQRFQPIDSSRENNQLRQITRTPQLISRADGSIHLQYGETNVICAVHGPIPCDRAKALPDRAYVDVAINQVATPQSTPSWFLQDSLYDTKGRTIELTQEIKALGETILDTRRYPRQKFMIAIQIISDDGSLSSVCQNALMEAILVGGVPAVMSTLSFTVAHIEVAGETAPQYKIDPTLTQESLATGILTVTLRQPNYIHNLNTKTSDKMYIPSVTSEINQQLEKQGINAAKSQDPDEKEDIIAIHTSKTWSFTHLNAALQLAKSVAQNLQQQAKTA